VKTPGVAQFTSWVIEECAKRNQFTIKLKPETKVTVIYFKDAAHAIIQLAEAPLDNIKTVNYLISGANPIASAGELADIVRSKIPGAKIDFKPDMETQAILDKLLLPLDDSNAKKEWGWQSRYDQGRIVDDFLEELKTNPQHYI